MVQQLDHVVGEVLDGVVGAGVVRRESYVAVVEPDHPERLGQQLAELVAPPEQVRAQPLDEDQRWLRLRAEGLVDGPRHRPACEPQTRATSSARMHGLELGLQVLELLSAGHQVEQLGLGLLAPAERRSDAALDQYDEPVADRQRVLGVVGDEDDGHAALLGAHDQLQGLAGLLDAEGRGRLVEDQELGAEVHGPRDGQRLSLAARQGAGQLPAVLDPSDAHPLELLDGDPVRQLLVEAAEREHPRLRLCPEEEVAGDAEERHGAAVLVDGADPSLPRLEGLENATA